MNIKNHTNEKLEDISKVVENPKNPNKHSDKQINMLSKIIEFQGWRIPIVVSNRSGFIVRGHGRLMSARKLGLEKVPVSFQDYESEAQEHADLIADNRIAELAEMDRAELKDIIEQLDTGEIDLGMTGFDQESLDDLMSEFFEPKDGLTDDDEIPVEVEKRCDLNDLWKLGDHFLLCGDCTLIDNAKRLFINGCPEIMITDPPYGVNYDPSWRADVGINKNKNKMGVVQNDDRADWKEAWDLFSGDLAYVYHAGLFTGVVGESLVASGFELRSQIIWAKDRMAMSRGDYHWQHEPCWYAVRKGAKGLRNDDRTQTTLWNIPARDDSGHGHGTQKPLECMSKPMANHKMISSVYDPFLGSGTTLIASEKMDKSCYGMELDPSYCDIIIQRWEDFTGKKAEKIN